MNNSRKRVFIDAGHNNSDWNTGAVGNGLKEQDINFSVAKKLGDILAKHGLEVKLSRPTKETNLGKDNASSINARYALANDWKADYFISIHCNAGGGTGVETLYYRQDSKKYAQTIQDTYMKEMGLRDRGIKYRDNIGVIMRANMPAILIELAFIDTAGDAAILRNKQDEMALAIAKGFFKLLGIAENKVKGEEKEMIDKINLKIDGNVYQVNRILKDGLNFVELQSFKQAGIEVSYDDKNRMPVMTLPKK